MKLFEIKETSPAPAHADFLTDPAEIEEWLKKTLKREYEKQYFKISEDGIVDVKDAFQVAIKLKTESRLPVRFGKCNTRFVLEGKSITSLEGMPQWCGENVIIERTNITSLDHFPKTVKGSIYLHNNPKLTSLKGLPNSCDGFACLQSAITTLEGMPQVTSSVDVSKNAKLVSLKGAPKRLSKSKDAHDYDAGKFICSKCPKLATLEGATAEVAEFICEDYEKLTSAKGLPRKARVMSITTHDWDAPFSILGIEKWVDHAEELEFQTVSEGGLGLILIPGLKSVVFSTQRENDEAVQGIKSTTEAAEIIRKYLGKPDQIFECQEELINNGHDEIAKL